MPLNQSGSEPGLNASYIPSLNPNLKQINIINPTSNLRLNTSITHPKPLLETIFELQFEPKFDSQFEIP